MTRVPYERIFIRETGSGPDVVFDAGVQGWPMPCTEQDLATLEEALAARREAREAKAEAAFVEAMLRCRTDGHDFPSDKPEPPAPEPGVPEVCGRCGVRRDSWLINMQLGPRRPAP